MNSADDIMQLFRRAGYMIANEGRQGLRAFALRIAEREDRGNDYAKWVAAYDTPTIDDLETTRILSNEFERRPLISILMPVYNVPEKFLRAAIDSVLAQTYPNWELCIANDCSTDAHVKVALSEYEQADSRIRVVHRAENGHISLASNSALDIAQGDWIALLDHDDELPPHALFCVVEAINSNASAQLIYSDEDKIDVNGSRSSPYFKCDWNADLFLSHNMISHFGVYRAALIREVGGFRIGFEGAQDYDLALRCVERIGPSEVCHIPRVLYHWRTLPGSTSLSFGQKPYAAVAGERALNDHLRRKNISARAERTDVGYRVKYALPTPNPLVSLIVPTRNGRALLERCVTSIRRSTTYKNYEILIVDNGSDDPKMLEYLEDLKAFGIKVTRDDRSFNYSAINNAAVATARGTIIGLLNNDVEVIAADWLSEMVSIATQDGVGAVGARLWYPNDRLQHGGVVLGMGGVAGHAHRLLRRGDPGYFGRAAIQQGMSAVTAACLVVRKDLYLEVGGLNEINLKVAFNDVDFCLKLLEKGYRNIWTPYAELYHHESATRGYEETPEKQRRFREEVDYMEHRWGNVLTRDCAYSPNLTLDRVDFSLAFPPRVPPVGASFHVGDRKTARPFLPLVEDRHMPPRRAGIQSVQNNEDNGLT